jgi:two-component system LytT family response regulator
MDGFDVLAHVGPENIPAIIFVTAFDQYALKAFEVHALDYLLKPFDDERFAFALRRAKSQIEAREINRVSKRLLALLEERESQRDGDSSTGYHASSPNASAEKTYLTRLMIKASGRVVLLKVGDIDFIEADGNYAKLHVKRKSHLLREKMHDLELRLDPAQFVRIHRSTIVNLDRIKELHPHFNGDYLVILEDGRQLRLSRTRRENLEARLKAVS